MNTPDIITRLKAHPGITDDTTVGVVSSFGKGAEIDIKADTRDIVATLTTSDIDLEDEVLVPSGGNMDYLLENGKLFADHNYDLNSYAGVLRTIAPVYSVSDKSNPRGWKIRFNVPNLPIGNTILAIVEHAGKIGVSVGFKVVDYGPPTPEEIAAHGVGGKKPRSIVRLWDAFEGSPTLLPCNVKCQAIRDGAAKSIYRVGPGSDELLHTADDLLRKGLIDRESAFRLGMPTTPTRKVFAVSETPEARRVVSFLANGAMMVRRG